MDHVYPPHVHFIIMTTNRKGLNGERNKSIKIDLAGLQWVRERAREGRVGEEGRKYYWRERNGEEAIQLEGSAFKGNFITFHKWKLAQHKVHSAACECITFTHSEQLYSYP